MLRQSCWLRQHACLISDCSSSLSIDIGTLHWFKFLSYSQRDDWQLSLMSVIWRENVTCLFLKINPLQFIHFYWSGLGFLFFFCSWVPNHWKFEDFLVRCRVKVLSYETRVGHILCQGPFLQGCFHTAYVAVHMGGCVCGTALMWIHAGVCSAWQESRWRQCSSPAVQWGDTRAGHAHTDTYCIHVELEAEERQYIKRQETGLQEVDMPGRIESAAPCNPDLRTPARFALLKILCLSGFIWGKNDTIFCAGPWNNNMDVQHTDPC